MAPAGTPPTRAYDADECRGIRTAFREDGGQLHCPRHPRTPLKVTWVEQTRLPNGTEMPTYLQVVCKDCGFSASIDMMESGPQV